MRPTLRKREVSPVILRAAEEQGFTPLQALVLAGRLHSAAPSELRRWVSPRLSDLDLPGSLPDIDAAADRIARAVIEREIVIPCCDYDADGVSGSAVIQLAFLQTFRHPPALLRPVIGLRLRDGYGVSSNVTDKILALAGGGPALVVTADQGSADEERIGRLLAHGIETVVTDHHEIPEAGIPRSAIACVNPTRRDSIFPDKFVAGVYVAFMVMAATRRRLIDLQYLPASTPSLSHLADLVALGTTADAVSFARSTNNRGITAFGLQLMNQPNGRPAWRALRQHLNKETDFTTADIAFTLGPLTNAAGRIDDAMCGVRFLMSRSEEEARGYLAQLHEANLARRAIEAEMKERALPIAQRAVDEGRVGLVVFMEDGHAGIHGVVCSRIVEAFGRPAACFSPKPGNASIITGSLRSIPGVHIRDCLAQIHAEAPDIQIGFGGHEGAAGTHMQRANLDRFVDAFDSAVRERVKGRKLHPSVQVDGTFPGSPTLQHVVEISHLAPFGREFDMPVFAIEAAVVSLKPIGNGSHLQLVLLDQQRQQHKAVWFFAMKPDEPPPVCEGEVHRFAVELAANTFRGRTTLQLIIRAAVPREN